jgi:hypothetical protein
MKFLALFQIFLKDSSCIISLILSVLNQTLSFMYFNANLIKLHDFFVLCLPFISMEKLQQNTISTIQKCIMKADSHVIHELLLVRPYFD